MDLIMTTQSVEVELLNYKMEYISRLRLPGNTIPMKGTKFHTKFSKFGIFKNSEYMVDDVIYEYSQTDDSDGYGNWGENTMRIKLVVTLLSYQTNEPPPVVNPAPVKKTRIRR